MSLSQETSVPRYVRSGPGRLYRLYRESCDGLAAEMFGSEWSEWTPLLYAVAQGAWYARGSLTKCPSASGVYELRVSDESGYVCVYLGKTSNLRRRMFAYAWRGSHLSPLLAGELSGGRRVEARWCLHADPTLVEKLMLCRIDYAWNTAGNGAVRAYSTCA